MLTIILQMYIALSQGCSHITRVYTDFCRIFRITNMRTRITPTKKTVNNDNRNLYTYSLFAEMPGRTSPNL